MPDLHQQMSRLSAQVNKLESRLGDVAGELADLRAAYGPFLSRYQQEVVPPHEMLVQRRREIADLETMLGSRRAMDSREIETPLTRLTRLTQPTVQEQYDRIWGDKKGQQNPDPLSALPPASPRLRQLYGEAVARLHPNLAQGALMQQRGPALLARAAQAYVRRDEVSLQGIVDSLRDRSLAPMIVDQATVSQMRDRVSALEALISAMEGESAELRYGDIARLRARADRAAAEGRDLLRELARQIAQEIELADQEIARLRGML
ncbi:MAG: hypothetical protein Kow00124_18950 [Anaerolineae bacterium]